VRAFAVKARSVKGDGQERWAGGSPLTFAREFMAYFRAMGYPLLRAADYPHVDAFLDAMANLTEADLLDPARLEAAVTEAERFREFLTDLFEAISRRDELAGAPFDRRAAALARFAQGTGTASRYARRRVGTGRNLLRYLRPVSCAPREARS